jgi:alanyl-tRNA synthetase
VGDNTHLTFLEMLGNFSFGPVGSDDPNDFGNKGTRPELVEGYFKRSAIRWAYDFLITGLGIDRNRLSVTVFSGDNIVPIDKESYDIWHKEIGLDPQKIAHRGKSDNFWGPTGSEGPCGPTTELYIDGIEVWNLVFNEYYSESNGVLRKLENPGIDTGMGFERLVAVIQGVNDVYETDLLEEIMKKIESYTPNLDIRIRKIFVDHLRAISFLIKDGVRPSNKESGYVLRRLIRRLLSYKIRYDIHSDFFEDVIQVIKRKYSPYYLNLADIKPILILLEEEKQKFELAISRGLKELQKMENIYGKDAFFLYETYGIPFEIIKELSLPGALKATHKEFEEEMRKHQEISRAGQEKKFGGHGLILDTGELKARNAEELDKVLRLHTTTHLLHQALRDVLGNNVMQAGSDITAERTRFDFEFNRKMTMDEIKKVEELINQKIKEDLPVGYKEMPKGEAEKTGALHFFKQKYPDRVKVYYVGHSLPSAYSKEFCGGPHVEHTGQIKGIKITKEEAVAAGIRRIRASLVD